MARIATKAQVVRALANAILNWLSPSDLSLVGITFYAVPFGFSRFQSVFFSVIKQICIELWLELDGLSSWPQERLRTGAGEAQKASEEKRLAPQLPIQES